LVVPQKKKVVKKSEGKPNPKGWRPKGKVVVKDKLHGVPHTIIKTDPAPKEQVEAAKKNPLNEKAEVIYAKDLYLQKIDECKMWKERALLSGKEIMELKDQIEVFKKGVDKTTTISVGVDAQKLKEQLIELQEKLQPFKYEFTVGGSLVSVMVRPRAREVIPLTQ
jgi:hypothetical protein